MTLPYQKVHVVINPAAGQDEPILNVLNHIFHPAGVDWEISLTHKSGDAKQKAADAAASGVDLVVAYGGDGTQMEVANGLLGTGVPQAILPGGTGNAIDVSELQSSPRFGRVEHGQGGAKRASTVFCGDARFLFTTDHGAEMRAL